MRLGSVSLITASLLLGAWMAPQSAYAARRSAKNSEGKPTKKGKKTKGSTKPAEGAEKEEEAEPTQAPTQNEATPAVAPAVAPATTPPSTPAAKPVEQLPAAEPAPILKSEAPTRKGKLIPALRVAVYDLELQEVPAALGVVVTDSLLSEVRKLQGVAAIGMNEIRDMLSHEATKQLAGCSENADSCMAELAGALGVDELVTGKLTQVGTERVMIVRRIDQKRAEVQGTFDQRLKAESGQELLASVGPAVEKLYGGYQLRDGTTRGVSKEVALRLDPPPLPKWTTITVGALAVGAAAAGGVFGLLALDAQKDYQNFAKLGTASNPIDGATLTAKGRDAQFRANMSTGFFIGAGATALVAGVMALFTDWHGYRDEMREASASR